MSDILAPEAVSRIDALYDTTLKPKLDAIDHQRRQVRWLIVMNPTASPVLTEAEAKWLTSEMKRVLAQ